MNQEELRHQLFHYMEDLVFGRQEMDPALAREIELRLQNDEELRSEAEEYRQRLQWLTSRPHPAVPTNLASRCLENLSETKQERTFIWTQWKVLIPALAILVLVFLSGQWFGGQRNVPIDTVENDPFPQLVQAQRELIEKVQDLYQRNAFTRTTDVSSTIDQFLITTDWLEKTYEMNPENYVVRRTIYVAIYQNIYVLQSLHESLSQLPQFQMASGIVPDTTGVENNI